MIARAGSRLAVGVAAVVVAAGCLTGCGREVHGFAPAPGAVASTPAPTPLAQESGASISSVTSDLDAANSATANAGGDVSDADSSAGTDDSP